MKPNLTKKKGHEVNMCTMQGKGATCCELLGLEGRAAGRQEEKASVRTLGSIGGRTRRLTNKRQPREQEKAQGGSTFTEGEDGSDSGKKEAGRRIDEGKEMEHFGVDNTRGDQKGSEGASKRAWVITDSRGMTNTVWMKSGRSLLVRYHMTDSRKSSK